VLKEKSKFQFLIEYNL